MSTGQPDTGDWLVTALDVLVDGEEDLTLAQIVRAMDRRGLALDTQAQMRLEQVLRRDGAAYIYPPDEADGVWSPTLEGREFVQRRSTDYEEQTPTAKAQLVADSATKYDDISVPFNPALIRVDPEQMPIYHALKLIQDERMILDPEFQRNFIWDVKRQSRLIESVMLRIPLPALYLNLTDASTYMVVDGRQRLTTLDAFCTRRTLRLTGLEFLKEHEGKTFDQLPLSLRTTIVERTKLTVYTIMPETPDQVKFMIFSRVNTGGLTLTAQEIRHAMFQGQATKTLNELSRSVEFLDATSRSIKTLRMDDRECVLRLLAFHFNPYEEFGTRLTPDEPANLDGLLTRTMGQLNQLSAGSVEQTKDMFRESMVKAQRVFVNYAFRKVYNTYDKRSPVNKALFEVWGVLLRDYPLADLERRSNAIFRAFMDLMNRDYEFVNAISYGTGSVASVKYRFQQIRRLLQEVMQ